jgi:LPXTG-motif cell wall-anchored protein
MTSQGTVLGAVTSTAGVGAALSLPNTGSNWYLTIALSVGVGLLTWGVMYARSR